MPIRLTPEELYKSAMRQRLTRAGLLKIMRENDARDAARIDNAANHAVSFTDED